MRLRNTTNFDINLIREIIRFVRPPGIKRFDVWVKNSRSGFSGRAYCYGTSYHDHGRMCPYIAVRVGDNKFPFTHSYPWLKNGPNITFENKEDILVYLLAHELRHLWQAKTKNRRGYANGSKGKFSEIDCEMYSKEMLEKWKSVQA